MVAAPDAILVVDDEKASTDLLRITLGMDFPVFTANDGETALRLLAEHPEIAVAIIDQRMPQMSGPELIRRTIEPYPDLVRIILTGYADLESVIEAINAGHVHRYLTKPWDKGELVGVVRQGMKLHRLERIRKVLNKVVSSEIAEEILRTGVQLGGEECVVSVLFADIRGFTALTRDMSPRDTIELLNGCMTNVSEVIERHGGVIDKYIGDAVMALFGAPVPREDGPLRAIRCGVEIIRSMGDWNVGRIDAGRLPLRLGVGIHTGLVVAGNMGGENRLNYTVVGANVNLASRICSSALGGEVVVSRDTVQAAGGPAVVGAVEKEPLRAKGLPKPMALFGIPVHSPGSAGS